MSYTNVYPSRINWENEPSIVSPINATNLNKMDYALYEMDGTLDNWDTTKANQSDLLLCVKSIDYDTTTGVFVFTWQNGTTKTVDLNIEKIPVSFSMDANGVITMTTSDGTQYTADVGSLIKTYSFNDSSEIDFTVTTDASGNKTVTASLVAGSITGDKLEPNYLANCQNAANSASGSATAADGSAEDAEAWAVGQRNGVDVPNTDPTYHNNSKYWSQQTPATSLSALTDTDINTPTDGQVLKYDGANSKWINGQAAAGGGSTVEVTTSESTLHGQAVTLTDGVTTLSTTFDNTGKATFTGVTLTGSVTISASASVQTATKSISIPYFGNYSTTLAFFSATITVTFDASKGATCTLDGQTATTSPHAFTVSSAGTYTASCTLDGVVKQGAAKVITTDGQTETDTIEYGTINLTYANEFRGQSITCTQGGTTITKTAPSAGNSLAFYPPTTGNWVISGTYSGTAYSKTATVSSLSTPVSITLETVPDGKTTTPTDDIQKWLACAQITGKSYTTLAQVLADSETYNRLLSDSNACDYMKRSTTWASTIVADANAMVTLGKYDYACYVLRSDNTWNTAINNSAYSSAIPASPTGQTDIVVAPPQSQVYYMQNGSPVTLCTTDNDGIGTVDWSSLPKGNITLYNTVAKDPTNLSNDYSKTVAITENTTEIYLMPDDYGLLYWFGWESSDLEDCISENGWGSTGVGSSITPTHNHNDISVDIPQTTGWSGIATKNKVDVTTAKVIYSQTANTTENIEVGLCTTKSNYGGTRLGRSQDGGTASGNMKLISYTHSSQVNAYIATSATRQDVNAYTVHFYAFLYE